MIPVAIAKSSAAALAADVLAGFAQSPRTLPSRWLYDRRGSELFRRISQLNEYYPTQCESDILLRHKADFAAALPSGRLRVWELGAGDGTKTEVLLAELLRREVTVEYLPVDICDDVLEDLAERMRRCFSRWPLTISPVPATYEEAFVRRASSNRVSNLVLFLGSSIGNMHHEEARLFLTSLRSRLNPGDCLLIGFDLKKDPRIMQAAYDDPTGVTRQFNLNLLDRLNRELDATFDKSKFRHHCTYNAEKGRMESWLLSTEPQEIVLAALERAYFFDAWEGIHVESSYKYDLNEIASLARASGFAVRRHFFDSKHYFVDSWLTVPS